MSDMARYIMIGGFLGAGKSTSILKLAQHLTKQGLRVGLITNDQGHGLVDTHNMKSHGFPVEEIPGGCFCCRFNSLLEAAENLEAETRPDVFIAEPVGSCTDLVASVTYPLRRIYGDRFSVAPLSVVVDPLRAMGVLGLRKGRNFSEKVRYIYLKQLEEASTIVINKVDLMEARDLHALEQALEERWPEKKVMRASARLGVGLKEWFSHLDVADESTGDTMAVDYQIYAEGEALLGWLNATVDFKSKTEVDGDKVLATLAEAVREDLNAREIEIAHFKMTLSPSDGSGELAVLSLVGSDYRGELSQNLLDPLDDGQLIVNLRAEGAPEDLAAVIEASLKRVSEAYAAEGLTLNLEHEEHFRPGEPKPIYRFANDQDIPEMAGV